MTRSVILALLCLLAPAASAAPHPSLWASSPLPNSLNLASAHVGGAGRRLHARADGAFPHEAASHSFVGITPKGFVDVRADAVIRNTTVRLYDYADILADSTFTCDAATITITVPRTRADAATAHFERRAHAGAVLVLDAAAAATHASFAEGTGCGALDFAAPFLMVRAARAAADGPSATTFTLEVAPAGAADAFASLDFSVDWQPDVAKALAARRAAGLPLGDAAAVADFERRRRRLASFDQKIIAININSAPGSPTAATKPQLTLPPFPASALACTNCFMSFDIGVRADVSLCATASACTPAIPAGPCGTCFLGKCTLGNVFASCNSDCDCGTLTPAIPAVCTPAGYADLGSGLTTSKPAACAALSTANTFDMALDFKAYVYGTAAYNFLITSSGISAATSTCPSSSQSIVDAAGAVDPACLKTLISFAEAEMPPLQFLVGSVPVTIVPAFQLQAAAASSDAFPGSLSFGSGASLSVSLGGGIAFPNLAGLSTPTLTAFSTFEPTYSSVPFTLSGFTALTGVVDTVIQPGIQLSLYGVAPVSANPQLRFTAAVGSTGAGAADNADAPACASGLSPFTLSGGLGLSVILGAQTLRSLATKFIKSFGGGFIADAIEKLIPDTPLWAQKTLFKTVLTRKTAVSRGCLAIASAGAPNSASTATGFFLPPPIGSAGAAGGLSILVIGLIAGGGALLVILLIVACVCCARRRKGKSALFNAGAPQVVVVPQPLRAHQLGQRVVIMQQQHLQMTTMQQPQMQPQGGGFCTGCGTQRQPGAKFCKGCGAPAGGAPASGAPASGAPASDAPAGDALSSGAQS